MVLGESVGLVQLRPVHAVANRFHLAPFAGVLGRHLVPVFGEIHRLLRAIGAAQEFRPAFRQWRGVRRPACCDQQQAGKGAMLVHAISSGARVCFAVGPLAVISCAAGDDHGSDSAIIITTATRAATSLELTWAWRSFFFRPLRQRVIDLRSAPEPMLLRSVRSKNGSATIGWFGYCPVTVDGRSAGLKGPVGSVRYHPSRAARRTAGVRCESTTGETASPHRAWRFPG